MNAQTGINNMQSIEATPLEDQSLPASEVFAMQQSELADESFAPTFIP